MRTARNSSNSATPAGDAPTADRLGWRSPPAVVTYLVPLFSVAAALAGIWWMEAAFQTAAHVSLFLCAVMFSAWFGGFRPALVAIGAALLAFDYFVLSPQQAFPVDFNHLPRLVLFALSALFVASLTAAQRKAAASLAEAHEALQIRSRELEETVRALRAENAERTRAEYLTDRMFDSWPDGVAVIGRDYRFRQVNQVYERLSQMPADRIAGMHHADVLGQDIFELAKPHLDRCYAGEEVRFSGWFHLRQGRRFLVGTCSPLRSPAAQEVEAALVISRDRTARVRAAEALREAQAKLEHVTRVTTLGEVTASLAHELNQPLAAIANNANACLSLLPRDPADPDDLRDALADVVSDAERASAIIERVRALAKRSLPQHVSVRLHEVVLDVLALVAADANARGVVIASDVPADLPVVLGDRVQLQQVLLNLIVNGMDAMSTVDASGRRIEIRGQRELHDDTPGVRIGIEDRGIGLSPVHADRLFEAFYTTKPHGMGLGLSISRSIIEAHGGQLWAAANTGPGMTLSFRLPAAAELARLGLTGKSGPQ